MTASIDKLDMMQARVRENLANRMTELDNILSAESSETLADVGHYDFSAQGLSGAYIPVEGLLTTE